MERSHFNRSGFRRADRANSGLEFSTRRLTALRQKWVKCKFFLLDRLGGNDL